MEGSARAASIVQTRHLGVLIVTLHRAQGLCVPPPHQRQDGLRLRDSEGQVESNNPVSRQAISSSPHSIYAVLDFDRSQAITRLAGGTCADLLWSDGNQSHMFDVSRPTQLDIYLYVGRSQAESTSERSQEAPVGHLQISYLLNEPREETRWFDLQHGPGKLLLSLKYTEASAQRLGIDDFEVLEVMGHGSFGKAMRVQKRDSLRVYAMKNIRKASTGPTTRDMLSLAQTSVLGQASSPFIAPLHLAFASSLKLHLLTPYMAGGELSRHLEREGRFEEDRARFYTAELACAFEHLHGLGFVYGCFDPDNALLDHRGHIVICDFELCRFGAEDQIRTGKSWESLVYTAPEVRSSQAYNETADWWILGALLYSMVTGIHPYQDERTADMSRTIINHLPASLEQDIASPTVKDLLARLLEPNPARRLGANAAVDIKAHAFFKSIDWAQLAKGKSEPVFKPDLVIKSQHPLYSDGCAWGPADDVPVEGPHLTPEIVREFGNFSYTQNELLRQRRLTEWTADCSTREM